MVIGMLKKAQIQEKYKCAFSLKLEFNNTSQSESINGSNERNLENFFCFLFSTSL